MSALFEYAFLINKTYGILEARKVGMRRETSRRKNTTMEKLNTTFRVNIH
jgi:hypothetical protein